MGTHPIFESDFDCLTDQKFQISKWPNHKWNLFFKICKKNLKVKSKRSTKLEMKKTESAKELVNSRLSSLKLKWSNQNLIFSAMMLLFYKLLHDIQKKMEKEQSDLQDLQMKAQQVQKAMQA